MFVACRINDMRQRPSIWLCPRGSYRKHASYAPFQTLSSVTVSKMLPLPLYETHISAWTTLDNNRARTDLQDLRNNGVTAYTSALLSTYETPRKARTTVRCIARQKNHVTCQRQRAQGTYRQHSTTKQKTINVSQQYTFIIAKPRVNVATRNRLHETRSLLCHSLLHQLPSFRLCLCCSLVL
jgi:hypothetical protein